MQCAVIQLRKPLSGFGSVIVILRLGPCHEEDTGLLEAAELHSGPGALHQQSRLPGSVQDQAHSRPWPGPQQPLQSSRHPLCGDCRPGLVTLGRWPGTSLPISPCAQHCCKRSSPPVSIKSAPIQPLPLLRGPRHGSANGLQAGSDMITCQSSRTGSCACIRRRSRLDA